MQQLGINTKNDGLAEKFGGDQALAHVVWIQKEKVRKWHEEIKLFIAQRGVKKTNLACYLKISRKTLHRKLEHAEFTYHEIDSIFDLRATFKWNDFNFPNETGKRNRTNQMLDDLRNAQQRDFQTMMILARIGCYCYRFMGTDFRNYGNL